MTTNKLTRETLVPIGLAIASVIMIAGLFWALATDRQSAFSRIERLETYVVESKAINQAMSKQLATIERSVLRLEVLLQKEP